MMDLECDVNGDLVLPLGILAIVGLFFLLGDTIHLSASPLVIIPMQCPSVSMSFPSLSQSTHRGESAI